MATTPMITVQAQVSVDVEERASSVLKRAGLTIDDAVRQMLTLTANEGELPFLPDGSISLIKGDDPKYDSWLLQQVDESLGDPRPAISREELDRRMSARRADASARLT